MKGLFIKDLELVLVNKRLLILLAVLAIFLANSMDDITFVYSFIIMIFGMIAISTLSYDNFNSSNAFLMTLPIKRKDYVIEKYLFILFMCVTGAVASIILNLIYCIVAGGKGEVDVIMGVTIGILAYISFVIPIELKFGSETGKIIPVLIMAFGFLGYQLTRNLDSFFNSGISSWILSTAKKFEKFGDAAIVIIGIVLALIIISISMIVSIKVINKKEF